MSTKLHKHRGSESGTFIEIGQDWLKILRAQRTPVGMMSSALFLEKLETSGAVAPERLLALLKQAGATKERVYAMIPRQMVTTRMLELPSTDPAEIADMVELQIGRQTPHAVDEIVTDYKVMGSGRKGYSRVMLAIVQRGVLRGRYSVLEEAGLRIERMSVGSEGLAQWFRTLSGVKSTGGIVVVDVDSFFSEVAVFEGQQLVFSRSVLTGANHLAADAEGAAERLAREVNGAIASFHGESEGSALDRVLVTGAPLALQTLGPVFEATLGMKVEVVDGLGGFKNLPPQPNRQEAPCHTVSLTALAGMAADPELLGFNLVPDSVRLRREVAAKAHHLSRLGILLMLLLVVVSTAGMLRLFLRRSQLQSLQQVAAQVAPEAQVVRDKLALINVVGERIDTRTSAVSLLYQARDKIPGDLGLALARLDLDADAGRFQLGGTAPSTEAVRKLARALEGVPYFRNVQESGDTSIDPQTGRYRFNLIGTIKGEP